MTLRRSSFIAWGHLKSRPFQLVALLLVIALASGLGVFLFLFSGGLERALIGATEPFELLVGARGGSWQLAMHTVLLQDQPVGNISFDVAEELKKDGRTRLVVPLAFGDFVQTFPLVGTDDGLMEIRIDAQSPPWWRLEEGQFFQNAFEVVAGAEAARVLGLKVGDSLQSIHGLEETVHEEIYRVTGIAAAVGGPYDHALFTSLESFWHSHGDAHYSGNGDDQGHKREVTTLLVYPSSYQAAYSLASSFQNRPDCQLTFPSQTLINFFALLGRGQKTLEGAAFVSLGVALLLTLLVLCGAVAGRSREGTLLRVLGATRGELMMIAWLEGLFCVALGALLGWSVARLALWVIFRAMSTTTALYLSSPLDVKECFFFGAALLCGALAGVVPALLNHRRALEDLS